MKVSVLVLTYNHGTFIRQCLDSIVAQKFSESWEILIGDDGSSDGTTEICAEFQKKHPHLIRHFIRNREHVIYINGRATGRYNFLELLKDATGDLLMICDGDDYWTDNLKIKRQFDVMQKHPKAAFTFHDVHVLKGEKLQEDHLNEITPRIVTGAFLGAGNCIRTCSVMFRNIYKNGIPPVLYTTAVGDYVLHLLHAEKGYGIYSKEKMAVYRMHEGGIWSTYKAMERSRDWMYMIDELLQVVKEPTQSNLRLQQAGICKKLIQYYQEEKNDLQVSELNLKLESINSAIIQDHLYKSKPKKKSIFSRVLQKIKRKLE